MIITFLNTGGSNVTLWVEASYMTGSASHWVEAIHVVWDTCVHVIDVVEDSMRILDLTMDRTIYLHINTVPQGVKLMQLVKVELLVHERTIQ